LLLIPIPAIRELAIAATIGVCVLLFTNLVLLPVILSITGVSTRAAARSLKQEEQGAGTKGVWEFFNRFAERRSWAAAAILIAVVLGIGGHVVSRKLQIGDLDPGAPELRAHSRYNIDNAFITANFSLSSDVFAVIIKTPVEQCMRYATLQQADQLACPCSNCRKSRRRFRSPTRSNRSLRERMKARRSGTRCRVTRKS